MANSHAGTSSDPQSSGSAYPLILDHLLSYPGTYEIPLRTMYTLNSAPRAQPLPQNFKQAAASGNGGRETPSNLQQDPSAQFTSALLSQISHLPSQPCSLPPSFINSFVRRCFTVELEAVDFPQALTALDYLKDLEHRRRREAANAFHRLGLDITKLDEDLEKLSLHYPGVISWVRSIQDKEKKVEALYTQLYIGLRRWVLINELQLPPFNKHNCVAMLNTLYPPIITTQPTTQLTPTVLKQQRDGWFRYISAVETNGSGVLENLSNQGRRAGDENGWPALRSTLDMYLRSATVVIAECSEIHDREHFSPEKASRTIGDENSRKRGRKADSGVSFSSNEHRRPSTSGTSGTSSSKHSAGSVASPASTTTSASIKASSALERLARELRRMRSKKPASADPAGSDMPPPAAVDDMAVTQPKVKKHATIRKMRSLGTLGDSKQKENYKTAKDAPALPKVDKELMKREMERAKRERDAAKAKESSKG